MSEKNILSLTLERLAHFNLEGEVDLENAENKAFRGYSDVYLTSLRRTNTRIALKRIRATIKEDAFAKVCRYRVIIFRLLFTT